jgi:mannose-6-phosphate isomerase-like protein (cupin superfamily)
MKEIKHDNNILAIIISNDFSRDGSTFFTQDDSSQQLAYMKYPVGKIIQPHVHNTVKREVYFTKEVLFIKKGKLRVDFYDDNKIYIESCVLCAGDLILLSMGGHGFTVLEDIEMFEVKQGPYAGDLDKIKFEGIEESKIILK